MKQFSNFDPKLSVPETLGCFSSVVTLSLPPPTPSIYVISFCFNYSPAPTLLNKPALQEHDSHTHSDTNQLLLIETFTLNFKVFTVRKLFLDTQGKIPHLILLPIKTLFCF